MDVMHGGVKA
ncbi:MAG: hypothetical protein EZS28_008366, partial [Streblomastix strix]